MESSTYWLLDLTTLTGYIDEDRHRCIEPSNSRAFQLFWQPHKVPYTTARLHKLFVPRLKSQYPIFKPESPLIVFSCFEWKSSIESVSPRRIPLLFITKMSTSIPSRAMVSTSLPKDPNVESPSIATTFLRDSRPEGRWALGALYASQAAIGRPMPIVAKVPASRRRRWYSRRKISQLMSMVSAPSTI